MLLIRKYDFIRRRIKASSDLCFPDSLNQVFLVWLQPRRAIPWIELHRPFPESLSLRTNFDRIDGRTTIIEVNGAPQEHLPLNWMLGKVSRRHHGDVHLIRCDR